MIEPVTAGPERPAAAGGAAKAPSAKDGALDRDAFLRLLVAQLRYQDPLAPSDASQFMAQSAQLAVVERLEEMSRQGTELLAGQRAAAAAGLIGRRVAWGEGDARREGVVSGARILPTGHVLVVGDRQVALDEVREVHESS